MPLTDTVQGGYGGEEINEEQDGYDSDNTMPELPPQRRIDVEDVWEGEPSAHTDDDECNFLGFRMKDDDDTCSGVEKNNRAIDKPKNSSRKKRLKKKTKTKLKKPPSTDDSDVIKPKPAKPRKKHDFTCLPPSRRGQNGWEDSLRPRPAQVQHYQSIVIMRKRKAETELLREFFEKRPFQEEESEFTEQEQNESEGSPMEVTDSNHSHSLSEQNQVNGEQLANGHEQQESNDDCSEILSKETRQHAKKQLPNGIVEPRPDCSEQDSDTEPRLDASVGEIVWAKLGSTRWWPAMVIWGSDCGQQPARLGQTWVFWFGDHKISEVPRDKLIDYTSNFCPMYAEGGSKTFKRGVVEAIRECAARANVEISDSDSSALLDWARQGFKTKSKNPGVFLPNPENPIPMNVSKYLNKIKSLNLQYYESCDTRSSQLAARTPRNECLDNKDSALKKVKEGLLKIEDACIACDSDRVQIVTQHPLFEGGLCKQCKDDIIETMYAYGEDGTNAYCVICGNAGELLICDNNDCNRVYCTGCIEIMVSPEACKKVLETSPWLCYLCADYDPVNNGLIHKKEDWQQNIMELFQPEKHLHIPNMEDYKEKRAIRVLSLFDGIGTGRYVLDQLGIEVETYYASEIDLDAVNVATMHHRTSVNQLGSIEDVTDADIAKLCPLDLVIGGSPCNDLSLVNPARKGLYDPTGTGKLFFDFFRILKAVQLANQGRHVFWLYENVASMPQEYKVTISRFLQVPPTTIVSNSSCEPAMHDSKYFSPQNRARYFWGNIPGMYTPLQPHLLQQRITLDSVLTPNCNRKAVVEKIRTVTTRSNSLKQGKKCILPVVMNGEGDVLWVTELELVFGFPKHYTDVGNIPLGRRQQLLGKAWSVPVIKHIFSPLRNFFKTVMNPSSS